MVKISVVKFNQILNEQRLDAESFDECYLRFISISASENWKPLKIFLKKCNRGILVNPTDKRTGFFYIKTKDVDGLFVKIDDLLNICGESYNHNKKAQVKEGDVLLNSTGVGSICRPAIWLYSNIRALVDNHVSILRTNKKLPPEYLFIFLLSRFGQLQLEKKVRGATGQIELYVNDIKKVKIFIPNDEQIINKIKNIVKKSFEKIRQAEQKYQQAEKKLCELLGINEEEIEKLEGERVYEVNFKEFKQAFRFDAEYYHPKYLGIIELLKETTFEIRSLKNVVEISNEKIDPNNKKNRNKKFRYVPIAKIAGSGEIYEWDEFYGWQAPSRARMIIKKGDILIPSLRGTFDKIALVPEELNKQLTTTGCFVVRADKNYPEFLFLLFRSPLFKRQLEQLTTGTIMSAVPKETFGSLIVPVIPKNKQKEVTNLVSEYFKLRKEARQLIQRAIRKIEEEIENAFMK